MGLWVCKGAHISALHVNFTSYKLVNTNFTAMQAPEDFHLPSTGLFQVSTQILCSAINTAVVTYAITLCIHILVSMQDQYFQHKRIWEYCQAIIYFSYFSINYSCLYTSYYIPFSSSGISWTKEKRKLCQDKYLKTTCNCYMRAKLLLHGAI